MVYQHSQGPVTGLTPFRTCLALLVLVNFGVLFIPSQSKGEVTALF